MMGTGSFAEPTFEALLAGPHQVVGLFTQPDRPTGKERGSTRQARRGMKELALDKQVPVWQPETINTTESASVLSALEPDLLVVAAYGQILSRDVLATARLGGINVHASLLPKYRGAAPIAWAIYHGETRTGVSIIRMSTALDAGDILAQEAVEIGPDETAGELEARLGPLGARLAFDVIHHLAQGPVQGAKQNKTQATKAPKLTKEHGLLDWNRTAEQVCNQIRAMQPWPTAYSFLHRPNHDPLRLLAFRARASPGKGPIQRSMSPGAVETINQKFIIQTGQGAVELLELQPAGKRRQTAAEFLRGHPLPPGSRFAGEPGA
ncbi:MAG: methionyl-tRNA formyltransferase [Planctomycetes bacterium]|nr:methionyl-tRNA formyltransferase [Planctomycetota bacterium]